MALTSSINFPIVRVQGASMISIENILYPEYNSYRFKPVPDLIVFKPSAGPDIVRRRSHRQFNVHSVSYNLQQFQREAFLTFFWDTLNGGVLSFNWQVSQQAHRLTVRIQAGSFNERAISPIVCNINFRLQELSRE